MGQCEIRNSSCGTTAWGSPARPYTLPGACFRCVKLKCYNRIRFEQQTGQKAVWLLWTYILICMQTSPHPSQGDNCKAHPSMNSKRSVLYKNRKNMMHNKTKGGQTALILQGTHWGTHLPEGEVAVWVGVGGEVPAVRSKGHCRDRPLVPMDCLARENI